MTENRNRSRPGRTQASFDTRCSSLEAAPRHAPGGNGPTSPDREKALAELGAPREAPHEPHGPYLTGIRVALPCSPVAERLDGDTEQTSCVPLAERPGQLTEHFLDFGTRRAEGERH
jgi:hypothetical protein